MTQILKTEFTIKLSKIVDLSQLYLFITLKVDLTL